MLPEIGNLWTDDAQAWTWYLALNEAVKSLLCLALAESVPAARIYGRAAAVWFLTQAADELTNGNIYTEHKWEYALLILVALTIWITQRTRK